MDDNNVLKGLKDLINNARKLKIDYGITGQEINRENNNIITFSSNTTMEVDYIEKKGYRETIRSDFSGTYTINEVFENYKEEIKKTDSNSDLEMLSELKFTEDEYNKIFKPGGKLHPLQVDELIPVDSQMNNKSCQVCYPSNAITDLISGYVKSTYAIYKKENYYDITMIMSQIDKESDIPMMQYCNTKIYIVE
ncbi:MAG: hypothetical protein SPI06_06815 [Terrisporobacter sp.]|uniref:hypothetical protein n=3 Tax=Terrisporobacter sp. TaxID=1965305 RepID=UPI002A91DE68|nr:hypothetical protein [Terrisporobacter sp.]MDY6153105.1 hypothetical protein [Terrisporobacter sp.]